MKTVSTNLQNLLINAINGNSTQLYMTDLYTFTLSNGSVLRYTDHDFDIQLSDGRVFTSIPIQRGDITEQVGINVDEMDLSIYFTTADTIAAPGNPTLYIALQSGTFDGAMFRLDRVFSPNPWTLNMAAISTDYLLCRFIGRVDINELKLTSASLKIKSLTELLNTQIPKTLIEPNCVNTIFDANCTLTKGNYTKNGAVTAGSSKTVINTNITMTEGQYKQGVILFTSGINLNIKRTIRSNTASGQITLILPLLNLPETGATITICPGCDGTMATCKNKYNNLLHFWGYPFVPIPETSL